MQVAEHPLLGSVREALLASGMAAKTTDETGATPILYSKCRTAYRDRHERRSVRVGGADFMAIASRAGDTSGRGSPCNFCRIDPPSWSATSSQWRHLRAGGATTRRGRSEHIFATAFTSFDAAVDKSLPQQIMHRGCRLSLHSRLLGLARRIRRKSKADGGASMPSPGGQQRSPGWYFSRR